MRRIPFKILLLIILASNWLAGINFAQEQASYAPDELLIRLKPSVKLSEFQRSLNQTAAFGKLRRQPSRQMSMSNLFSSSISATLKNPSNSIDLSHFVKLKIQEPTLFKQMLDTLQKHPQVLYAQPNYVRRIHYQPNDPDYSRQWAIQKCAIDQAWDVQRGSKDIILAIIDTGIDYEHEDLQENLWINPAEDINGNGVLDPEDVNGIDDDRNGFIDDIRGWDFTDAPAWPDGGDYIDRDNDPNDENGHGTAVAGIVGAVADNGLGISGVAPGCKIMNLRAGTSRGLLEEDDVASAIVYAVDNGARVINMSFGDLVASPFLRDVMLFAYQQNCVLVASAGNSGTYTAHYPSGYMETISVGATNSDDLLAGYSNYGPSVDIVAPGVDIWSTEMGNKYSSFGGTSAAAPFVTAICGLLLSQQSELSAEAVKGRLMAGADDLGEPGWDSYYAAGRLNALRALALEDLPIARIQFPRMDQGFSAENIKIIGTAAGALLDYYELSYGVGENPDEYIALCMRKNAQIVEDSLGFWDTSVLSDTIYSLCLRVYSKNLTSIEDKILISIDRTPPVISNVSLFNMIDGSRHSVLIEFLTDDVSEATLAYRLENSNDRFQELTLAYESREHRFNFSQNQARARLEFYIEARNRSGLSTIDDHTGQFYQLDLSLPTITSSDFVSTDFSLPPGYLLNKASDFDEDGNREILFSQYDNQHSFGLLKIYEFQNNGFSEVYSTNCVAIPKDWGDSDGDGLYEILTNLGATSFIWESAGVDSFSYQIVWSDTNDFWASRFADLDGDGKGEIIARIKNVFSVLEMVGDNHYTLIDSLPNPTSGTNITGVPHSEIGDFDGDGHQEILLGDYDGDIYIYEAIGDNTFRFEWCDSLPLMDAIDFLSTGDYDGDGLPEFVAGCHSDPGLDHEHEYDSRHWLFRIYKADAKNQYIPVWEQRFFGFLPPQDYDSAVSSGDVDNDERDELILMLFPHCYIADYHEESQAYHLAWYHSPCRSNAAVVCDIDRDEQNEFFFNNGSEIVGFRAFSTDGGPATPLGLSAHILDTNRVQLTWFEIANSQAYRLYRGVHRDSLKRLAQIQSPHFIDTTIQKDVHYYYAVTAIDTMLAQRESRQSQILHIHPSDRPYVVSAEFLLPRQILLDYSEPMNASVKNSSNYRIDHDFGTPASVVSHKSGQQVVLTLRDCPPNNLTLLITVSNMYDQDNMPIDSARNQASLFVSHPPTAPYLIRADLSSKSRLTLIFNEALDNATVQNIENYTIEPNVNITKAVLDPTDPRMIQLTIDPQTPIGAYGKNYLIRVANVANLSGQKIQWGRGDGASLVFYKQDLSQVNVFPNPYIMSREHNSITFINLTPNASIKILTLSGQLVNSIEETDGNGGVTWDLKNERGQQISSGIYLYYVEANGQSKIGKFAVIR